MNTPNPLVPQGTLPDKGKAQVRITVFAILAVHVVLLGVLLIAGCNKKTQEDPGATAESGLPSIPTAPAGNDPLVEAAPSTPVTPPGPEVNGIPPVPPPLTQEVAQPTPLPGATPPVNNFTPPVPTPTPTPAPSPLPTAVTPETTMGLVEHTIAKGESFYTLGKKYNVGYKAIADANPGINPNRLKIGDKVKIPPPRNAAPSSGTAAMANPDGGAKTYKVRSGDNLMKIAKVHGVTVKQLRAANNLRTDQIKVGQVLKIPAKPVEAPVEAAPPAVPPVTPPPAFPSQPNP